MYALTKLMYAVLSNQPKQIVNSLQGPTVGLIWPGSDILSGAVILH